MNIPPHLNFPIWRPDPAIVADQNAASREYERRREDQISRLEDKIAAIDTQLFQLESRRELVTLRLAEAGRPPEELWGAVRPLLFLVIGGIVYPLLLMPAHTEQGIWGRKAIAIGLFVVGLCWVLAHMLSLLIASREPSKNSDHQSPDA
jgi:hypothetical protein